MRRFVKISRFALPLLVAGLATALRLQHGEAGAGLVLLMLGGALLGGAAALMLESVAALFGLVPAVAAIGDRRRELLREKELLLRSLRDVELDAALQKVDAEQAAQLSESYQQRVAAIETELCRLRRESTVGIEEQIERELSQRLSSGGENPAREAT